MNPALTSMVLTRGGWAICFSQGSKSSCWGDSYLCSYTNILLPHLPKQIYSGHSAID